MGLLTEGKPLLWTDSLKLLLYIKEHGTSQFINVWKQYKDRCCDSFKWGDELEYLIVYVPKNTRIAKLSLRSKDIQHDCQELLSQIDKKLDDDEKVIVHPEYGSFMIEATPFVPYGDKCNDLLLVEKNMAQRRYIIEKCLNENEKLMALTSFGILGNNIHTYPHFFPNGPVSQSQYVSDAIINPHPRFATLTRNIRLRRGKKVDIHVPIYRDKNTLLNEEEIIMDAMAFGMGCCCLQVTFQAKNINEARHLYDQLAVLSPIMMALTAATPFLHGKISDLDVRWTVISQSVDDRTDGELGNAPLKENEQRIYKSRYDTIDCYISTCNWLKDEYNDIPLVINEQSYNQLIKAGCDERLSKHIAHLFIRDPLVIYSDLIEVDDSSSNHHFETIQSTNWQNVRFKPPPLGSDIGWRVEFRTMEIQMTEFENAAFSIFVTLVSRAILFYGLNFYIPISKVDENFKHGHKRNAVLKEKFWWRTCNSQHGELKMEQLTITEILCGKQDNCECLGLIDIVQDYINQVKCEENTKDIINKYLNFIRDRATGKILTTAQWLRNYVNNHPLYKFDSNLNEQIYRDILDITHDICHGKVSVPKLLGDIKLTQFKTKLNEIIKQDKKQQNKKSPTLLSKL